MVFYLMTSWHLCLKIALLQRRLISYNFPQMTVKICLIPSKLGNLIKKLPAISRKKLKRKSIKNTDYIDIFNSDYDGESELSTLKDANEN